MLLLLQLFVADLLKALTGTHPLCLQVLPSQAGYIALDDLTKAGDIIRSRTYSAMMPFLAVALLYLIMVMFFSHLLKMFERRLAGSGR